jgi:hypothetical protein
MELTFFSFTGSRNILTTTGWNCNYTSTCTTIDNINICSIVLLGVWPSAETSAVIESGLCYYITWWSRGQINVDLLVKLWTECVSCSCYSSLGTLYVGSFRVRWLDAEISIFTRFNSISLAGSPEIPRTSNHAVQYLHSENFPQRGKLCSKVWLCRRSVGDAALRSQRVLSTLQPLKLIFGLKHD